MYMQSDETARRNFGAILKALAKTGLDPVAAACRVDPSTISKWKEPQRELERFSILLAACGLKVVSEDMQYFRLKDIEALMHFAKQRLDSLHSAEDLVLFRDDPE